MPGQLSDTDGTAVKMNHIKQDSRLTVLCILTIIAVKQEDLDAGLAIL